MAIKDSVSNGEVEYVDQKQYLLPKAAGKTEGQRLENQSRGMWELMGGRHFHALIQDDPSLLIDVGCGSGAVSISMGLKYPGAEIIGIDLSEVPSTSVAPPNVTFLQGDVRKLTGKIPKLQPNTADLVYSRLLLCGIKYLDWPSHVKNLMSLVKPGGYLELIEGEIQPYKSEDPNNNFMGSRIPLRLEAYDAFRECLGPKGYGIDPDIGKHLAEHMRKAGLVDVQERVYPLAGGKWIGQYVPSAVTLATVDQSSVTGVITSVMKGHYSEEKIEEYKEFMMKFRNGELPGTFMVIHAVTGRKPEA